MSDSQKLPRIFKTTWFVRFARREQISDAALREAIANAEQGLIDADLGGNVIKQRVARPGQGKSGGYRTIIIFRQGDRSFFMYGFAKSDRDNLRTDELKDYKEAAKIYLGMSDDQIERLIDAGDLTEI